MSTIGWLITALGAVLVLLAVAPPRWWGRRRPDSEVAQQRRDLHDMKEAAMRTLERLRYTWEGGEEWKPPLGAPPDFAWLDSLRAAQIRREASLERQVQMLEAEVDRLEAALAQRMARDPWTLSGPELREYAHTEGMAKSILATMDDADIRGALVFKAKHGRLP